jgi:hypothetical protein
MSNDEEYRILQQAYDNIHRLRWKRLRGLGVEFDVDTDNWSGARCNAHASFGSVRIPIVCGDTPAIVARGLANAIRRVASDIFDVSGEI